MSTGTVQEDLMAAAGETDMTIVNGTAPITTGTALINGPLDGLSTRGERP